MVHPAGADVPGLPLQCPLGCQVGVAGRLGLGIPLRRVAEEADRLAGGAEDVVDLIAGLALAVAVGLEVVVFGQGVGEEFVGVERPAEEDQLRAAPVVFVADAEGRLVLGRKRGEPDGEPAAPVEPTAGADDFNADHLDALYRADERRGPDVGAKAEPRCGVVLPDVHAHGGCQGTAEFALDDHAAGKLAHETFEIVPKHADNAADGGPAGDDPAKVGHVNHLSVIRMPLRWSISC